jgi:hypothetical protein
MNLKIFALMTIINLSACAVALSNLAQPVQATNNDKCFTIQSKDRSETTRICGTGDHEGESLLHEFKKQCKDNTENKETRCSSSQTGNGAFSNEKNKD